MSERLIFVTGATGFVGRRVTAALLARGDRVRAGVREGSTPFQPNARLEFAALDLSKPIDSGLFYGVNCIVHAGAYIPSDHNNPDLAERCLQVNALGTLSLLRAATEARVSRFLFCSSGNIYAAKPGSVAETDAIYPSARASYYLASKVTGDTFVDHFHRSGKLSTAIVRLSSVYGPGMVSSGLLPNAVKRIRAREILNLQEGGRFRTDLVHVDDVVAALLSAIDRDVSGPFNIGSGIESTALTVARTVLDLMNAHESLLHIEPPTSTDSLGFSPLNISRARTELDYSPRSLRDGIADYIGSLT